jgi:hypothetical protein
MKQLKIAVISALLILSAGMAVGQDAAHDVDKVATKTRHTVHHAAKQMAKSSKAGVKTVEHGTKTAARETAKDVKSGSEKTGEGIKDVVAK